MNNPTSSKTTLLKNPYLQLNNQGQIIPCFNLIKGIHILGRNPEIADLVVPKTWDIVSGIQATIKKQGTDYYIYDGDGINPSTNNLFINNRLITPQHGYCLQDKDEIRIGQNPHDTVIISFHDPNTNQYSIGQVKQNSISLLNRSVVLGRDENANLQLDSPIVSRKHAVIDNDGNGNYILHDFSANGVFVNDIKVKGKTTLKSGAVIKISPYTLVLQGDQLVVIDRGENIRLEAEKIGLIVKNKKKEYVTLLNDITLPIEPGQFVAIVGGSGAGKSTFMRALLGIQSTTEGDVYLNGAKLRENFNIYRTSIGYVPQTDIIHKDLKLLLLLNLCE